MTNYTAPAQPDWSGQSSFGVEYSFPTLIASGNFIYKGLRIVEAREGTYHYVAKYVGERNVPHDILRLRRYVYEVCRRMGTPVLYKKMLNEDDMFTGMVTKSPAFDPVYGQTRNRDPLSHGIGFISTELSTDEWINPKTGAVTQNNKQIENWEAAPRYRGYGPGMLIYMIEPDAAVDFFKTTPEGVFQKVQTATAIAPWWPDINDNDLLIHVELDRSGRILGTGERYQAKQSNPVSIRGSNERTKPGRHEYTGDFGTRYVVNTTFQMVLLPENSELQHVEVDR
jgi:hypothetical protein